MMDNEQRWIRKLKRKRDNNAANQLVEKYYKEIYAFVYKQTLDPELSLDLTQEIFINVLKSIPRFEGKKASFRTWLYKLASNRLVDYYRSRHYKTVQLAEPLEEHTFRDQRDFVVSLEYKEDFEKVTSLINQLDARTQPILRLKLFAEYTFQEIAASEELPLSTVKTRYYRAMRWIRKKMKEEPHE